MIVLGSSKGNTGKKMGVLPWRRLVHSAMFPKPDDGVCCCNVPFPVCQNTTQHVRKGSES